MAPDEACERAAYLNKWADLVEKNAEQLAELDTLDLGLMISSTRQFGFGAAASVREAASWINKIFGETAPSGEDQFNFTLRSPWESRELSYRGTLPRFWLRPSPRSRWHAATP